MQYTHSVVLQTDGYMYVCCVDDTYYYGEWWMLKFQQKTQTEILVRLSEHQAMIIVYNKRDSECKPSSCCGVGVGGETVNALRVQF